MAIMYIQCISNNNFYRINSRDQTILNLNDQELQRYQELTIDTSIDSQHFLIKVVVEIFNQPQPTADLMWTASNTIPTSTTTSISMNKSITGIQIFNEDQIDKLEVLYNI